MLAADKIKRLNRLYAVSSGINEAIVRTPGEAQLYVEACRIAVERGGLAMAWVGLMDPTLAVLKPVARCGKDDGYIDSIRIATASTSQAGQGPGGRAFRSGKAAVANDIESDTQYFAYRDEALARGFRSCAAFPLKLGGDPVGVFFVYASDPFYFDDEEVALLSSLADNFSFAIEAREREMQRAAMEAAVRASEARLRAVIENEPECVKVLTPEGDMLDMNPAGLAMLEAQSPAALLGHNVLEFLHPDDRDAYRGMLQRVQAGGTERLQARAIGLKGRLLWMDTHAAPLRAEDGTVTSVLCVARDVTQEHDAMDTMRQQQSLLAIASRLGRIGAWAVELSTNKVTWSDELCVIHEMPAGFSPTLEEAVDFYAPEHRQLVSTLFNTCRIKGVPFDCELDIVTRTGRRLCVRSIGEAVRDSHSAIVRVQGAFQDITEHLAAQREILRLNAELEQRVRQRTAQLEMANLELQAFSYSVAHDLRAPLTAIGGFSQALEGALTPARDPRVLHYLSRMREGVLRTSEMIDALLSLSQVSRTELRWESVDLSALAQRACENSRLQSPGRDVAVRIQPGMTAHGDARLLQLVMDNLVGNAWKFTAGSADASVEICSICGPEGETVYEVRDNGVGFDMTYSANLFGAFQRLHKQTEFPGTGIGLANVRRIVVRHSGRIWAHSAPGQGTVFYFTLGDEPA